MKLTRRIWQWLWQCSCGCCLICKVDRALRLIQSNNDMQEITMATLQEILDRQAAILEKVTACDTRLDSVRELILGLKQQIADLLASQGSIPQEVLDGADAIFAKAEENLAEINAAIDSGTTPPPATP